MPSLTQPVLATANSKPRAPHRVLTINISSPQAKGLWTPDSFSVNNAYYWMSLTWCSLPVILNSSLTVC